VRLKEQVVFHCARDNDKKLIAAAHGKLATNCVFFAESELAFGLLVIPGVMSSRGPSVRFPS
jgi:hypothetical protein